MLLLIGIYRTLCKQTAHLCLLLRLLVTARLLRSRGARQVGLVEQTQGDTKGGGNGEVHRAAGG